MISPADQARLFARLSKLRSDVDELLQEMVVLLTEPDVQKACIGKKRYSSAEAAGKGATKARASGSTDDLRIYACPFCREYHLTKTPLELLAGVRS